MSVHLVRRYVHMREGKLRGDEAYTITFDDARDPVCEASVHCAVVDSAYAVAHVRQDVGYARVLFKNDGPLALFCGTSGGGGLLPATCAQSLILRGLPQVPILRHRWLRHVR